MVEIQKSIVESLDGLDIELFPFLPYILQDLWEIGADPRIMLTLIEENVDNPNPKVLDLGCGKGAVAVTIAKELNCSVKGIDGLPEFIETARLYAEKYQVHHLCEFETGDIRTKMYELKGFDIVILGAIGPVFGNLYETLQVVNNVFRTEGYVLLDESYLDDDSPGNGDHCVRKSEFYQQITLAGFEIVQEWIFDKELIRVSDRSIYESIENRVKELIRLHPEKSDLLKGYLASQTTENNRLENELVSGTWLLKAK